MSPADIVSSQRLWEAHTVFHFSRSNLGHRPKQQVTIEGQDSNEDSTDVDYQPPDCNMEDIWELEDPRRQLVHSLFKFDYADEARKCYGTMSDAGLSTDDPDQGYRESWKLHHPVIWTAGEDTLFVTDGLCRSLGPLLSPACWYDIRVLNYIFRDGKLCGPPKDVVMKQHYLRSWYNIRCKAEYGFQFQTPVDFEARLDQLLVSNHLEFYFDDQEWEEFPSFHVIYRCPNPQFQD